MEHGPEAARAFLSQCQYLTNHWLLQHGMSIGIGDTVADYATMQAINETINKVTAGDVSTTNLSVVCLASNQRAAGPRQGIVSCLSLFSIAPTKLSIAATNFHMLLVGEASPACLADCTARCGLVTRAEHITRSCVAGQGRSAEADCEGTGRSTGGAARPHHHGVI